MVSIQEWFLKSVICNEYRSSLHFFTSFSATYCEQCGSLFSPNQNRRRQIRTCRFGWTDYVESDVCVRSPLVCQSGIGSSTWGIEYQSSSRSEGFLCLFLVSYETQFWKNYSNNQNTLYKIVPVSSGDYFWGSNHQGEGFFYSVSCHVILCHSMSFPVILIHSKSFLVILSHSKSF